jgi:hypothetical protein
MSEYQIRFITHSGIVFGTDRFTAENDERAISKAHAVYRTRFGKGYEIWQDSRHVHTELYR